MFKFIFYTLAILVPTSYAFLHGVPDSKQLQKRIVKRILKDDTWWVCFPWNAASSVEGSASYFSTDVYAAVYAGYLAESDSEPATSNSGAAYPHDFGNIENILLDRFCDADRLAEYPIKVATPFYSDTDPGPDRVVFDKLTGNFCGLITHRGHTDNSFHRCYQHTEAIGDHDSQYDAKINLEPPVMEYLPLLGGIGGASSGIGKLKREDVTFLSDQDHPPNMRRDNPLPLEANTTTLEFAACPSTPACNAPGCLGDNNAGNSTMGICRDGDCTGLACTNVCQSSQACTANGCDGRADSTGKNGECTDGDYVGCACTPSCGLSTQDCRTCNGTSFNNGTGICGPGDQHGCPCQSACGPLGPCNLGNCSGQNDPHGGPGVCLDSFRGCKCDSVCKTTDCDANGCQGFNNQTSSGQNVAGLCLAGDLLNCQCNSVCPQTMLKCDDKPSSCTGLNNSTGNGVCMDGDYQGCQCQSTCSRPSLQCNDPNCYGQNGKCQSGDQWGCNCSGDSAPIQTSSSAPPSQTMACSNPSLEDGDGLCTCQFNQQTIGTFTPTGGNCPTAIPSGISTPAPPPPSSTPPPPPPVTTLECSNPSPEDGDGKCTCSIGASTVGTYTPNGGNCPTTIPSS